MVVVILFSVLLAQTGFANQKQEPVQVKKCVMCHETDGGSSSDDTVPKIAGLGDTYFRKAMFSFLKKKRKEPTASMMYKVISSSTSDADLDIIVDYFSHQEPVPAPVADPALAAKGKIIYDEGLPAKGIIACAACHGDRGDANFSIPRIAGQNISYQLTQFDAFTQQTRKDVDSKMMARMILNLTTDELTALAHYINTL